MQALQQNDGLTKFQRYRQRHHGQGLKLLRVWVPNPHAAGFIEASHRQAVALRGAPEEDEALIFIEQAADWGDAAA